MGAFSIRNTTRTRVRVSLYKKMKEAVLGKRYELSVALVSPLESRRVTKLAKKKDKVSNVLSFPLAKNSGEIILCPKGVGEYTLEYLFIHGLLHLKGLKHSATMDAAEERVLRQFDVCKKSSQA